MPRFSGCQHAGYCDQVTVSAEIPSKRIKARETPVTPSRVALRVLNIPNGMVNLQGNGDNCFFSHRFRTEVGNNYTASSSVEKHSKGTFKLKDCPNTKIIFHRQSLLLQMRLLS